MPSRLLSIPVLVVLAACATGRSGSSRTTRASAPAAERITFVDGGAGRLRVSDGGSGEPAVVLVHGLGGDLEGWRAQLDHLRRGHRAIAYDQRGHGGSDRPRDGVYTIDALASDLDAVVTALGVPRFVLVGHSLSGGVITAYAGAHPEKVAGLVYLDATGDFSGVPRGALDEVIRKDAASGPEQQRADFVEMLGPARPETRAQVLASLERMDPVAFAALRRSAFELPARERFARRAGPAVAIEVAGPADEYRASRVFGLRRVEIANVSHWLQLDDPARVSAELDSFLAEVGPGGR